MAPCTVVNVDDSALPLVRATVSVAAAGAVHVPLVNRLNVINPIGVAPLPVTVALSCTTVPAAAIWPVTSTWEASWIWVEVEELYLETVSASQIPDDAA